MLTIIKGIVKSIPGVGGLAQKVYRSLVPEPVVAKGYFSEEVARHLFFAVEYVYYAEVDGDVAEFGTMSGDSSTAIAKAMAFCPDLGKIPKKLHLFDSFEGLPEISSVVDQQNQHVKSGVWDAGACKVLDQEQLRIRISEHLPPERIVMHAGWYSDSVPRLAPERKFGLIHVDCDLYQSTMDALGTLLRRGMISEGALILFDDWNCSRASPDLGERRAWAELSQMHQIQASDLGPYSWAGHKFIVHSYQTEPGELVETEKPVSGSGA